MSTAVSRALHDKRESEGQTCHFVQSNFQSKEGLTKCLGEDDAVSSAASDRADVLIYVVVQLAVVGR